MPQDKGASTSSTGLSSASPIEPVPVSPLRASIPSAGAWTAAWYARKVSQVAQYAAKEMRELAEGMWNPNFCASDPTYRAVIFIEDLRRWLDHIEGRYHPAQGIEAGTDETPQAAQPEGREPGPATQDAPITALQSKITALEKALEPFVRHGRAIGVYHGDAGPFWIMTDTGRRDVPAADFIAAHKALKGDGD